MRVLLCPPGVNKAKLGCQVKGIIILWPKSLSSSEMGRAANSRLQTSRPRFQYILPPLQFTWTSKVGPEIDSIVRKAGRCCYPEGAAPPKTQL